MFSNIRASYRKNKGIINVMQLVFCAGFAACWIITNISKA
jgi:hypothetical protein